MAVTGLFLILFLLMHMFGNLKLLLPDGKHHFNEYSEHLRNFLAPIMPHMWFLWLFRAILVVCFILHIWSAISLWKRNKTNVGMKRYNTYKGASYVSSIMRWGGVTILLFVLFHLANFTIEWITPGYSGTRRADGHIRDSADRVILGFGQWWMVLLYGLAMLAVCLHVWRGFWSAFATLGANVSKGAERVLNVCAAIIAALLFIGFMITPVMILAGMVH